MNKVVRNSGEQREVDIHPSAPEKLQQKAKRLGIEEILIGEAKTRLTSN